VLNELFCTPDHRLQMLTLADRLGVTRGGLTRDRRPARRARLGQPGPTGAQPSRGLRGDHRRGRARGAAHARGHIRVLRQTRGTHLDDAALDELAASLTKLRDAIT
jgi:hypothetical protein